MATTPFGRLLVEAVVVAIGLVLLFFLVHALFMRFFAERAMTDHALLAAQVAITGALFHVGCEYTGINEWYCRSRRPSP